MFLHSFVPSPNKGVLGARFIFPEFLTIGTDKVWSLRLVQMIGRPLRLQAPCVTHHVSSTSKNKSVYFNKIIIAKLIP